VPVLCFPHNAGEQAQAIKSLSMDVVDELLSGGGWDCE